MRLLLTGLLLFIFPLTAVAADSPWPPIPQGQPYAAPPVVPTPSATALKKAPVTDAHGVTIVFFPPGSEGLESQIDGAYTSGGYFAGVWDELIKGGVTMQLQWWKFAGTHNGAYGTFDPNRPGHNISVAIDPNDASGNPYPPGILETNIVRGVFMAYFGWTAYKRFAH